MTAPDIHIPDEARKAAKAAYNSALDRGEASIEKLVDAACLAMLRAWPGMRDSQHVSFDGRVENAIILPLTQEPSDDHT